MRRRASLSIIVVVLLIATFVAGWSTGAPERRALDGEPSPSGRASTGGSLTEVPQSEVGRAVTLAFAGDVHFEAGLADLPDEPRSTLGPMSRHLRGADLAMVNLESALVRSGERTAKELEVPDERYWFNTSPAALDLFARSGVDVVSLANNHGADFGAAGLRQTLAAAEDSEVAVVGVGASPRAAFAPYRTTIKGTDISVLAADAVRRESDNPVWAAGEGGPGIASARGPRTGRLLAAVERAHSRGDLVVVYLHWGRDRVQCPTGGQRRLAQALAAAGADVVVGTHAHVLLGAGMLGDTYVSYGLGNFAWYHGARSNTGVLKLRVRDGRVVADEFEPARIPVQGGLPVPAQGSRRSADRAAWERLRECTDLQLLQDRRPQQGQSEERPESRSSDDLPPFEAQVSRLGPAVREQMIGRSHDVGSCPVALADLRHLKMSYVGFDGRQHTGEMVIHADHTADVVRVFQRLYEAHWPIRRMRLVSSYGGSDNRSMAANNTSGYNCRRVAGQNGWSQHAYGAAIDINPVQNPYLTTRGVLPPQGGRFADADRFADAAPETGVIKRGDVVVRAFREIGWAWGGNWTQPDYQHFVAP